MACDKKTNVKDTNSGSTSNTKLTKNDEVEDVWRDFLGITPDLPEHREKCENCR